MVRAIPVAIVAGAMLLGASAAWSQQKAAFPKKRFVGIWTFVSAESVAKDGSKLPLIEGRNPMGQLIVDDKRFSYLVVAELSRVASNDPLKTTPEENAAAARGTRAYYGTYSLNEADGTVTLTIERSSFPNENGRVVKRVIKKLTASELVYVDPEPVDGRVNTGVWKRAR